MRETIDDIVTADRRAGDVIRARLHHMLKRADAQLHPLDVNEVVREVVDLAHGDLVARGVKVSMRLQDGLPPVPADRVQIQQVLLNLILNGCDAMTAVADEAKELTVTTDGDGDGRVEVRVRDRGTGIPIGDVERIFEPFVTSKQKGLGLGLAISRSIATSHWRPPVGDQQRGRPRRDDAPRPSRSRRVPAGGGSLRPRLRRRATPRRRDSFVVAERGGFEPPEELPPHVISSHADSASLASLRS